MGYGLEGKGQTVGAMVRVWAAWVRMRLRASIKVGIRVKVRVRVRIRVRIRVVVGFTSVTILLTDSISRAVA